MLDYGLKRSFTFSRQKRGGYGDVRGEAPKPPGPSGISGSKASEDSRAEAHVPDERNDGHIVKNAARAKRRAVTLGNGGYVHVMNTVKKLNTDRIAHGNFAAEIVELFNIPLRL